MSHPLDELLSLAERTYVRLEAEQLIDDCLRKGDPTPFDELLEELVMAGSKSLTVLREILGAIRTVKTSLSQEGLGVRQDLIDALAEYGIKLNQIISVEAPESFWRITRQDLHKEVMKRVISLPTEDETLLEEICIEAGKQVTRIARRLVILNRFEESVIDWIDGLAYVIVHTAEEASAASQDPPLH